MGVVVNQDQIQSSVSPLFVGIDVSGEFLDVAYHESNEYFRVPNSPDGIAALVAKLIPLKPERVVLEATGKLERAVLEALCQAGLPGVAVNPKWVRDFAKSTGRLAKTDRIDARVIAHYGAAVKPKVRPLNDEQTQQLQANLRRAQLIDMLTADKIAANALIKPPSAASMNSYSSSSSASRMLTTTSTPSCAPPISGVRPRRCCAPPQASAKAPPNPHRVPA